MQGPGFGYLIGGAGSALRGGLERELKPLGISAAQWPILEAASRGEATTLTELTRIIPIDAASISRQIEKLRAKGLISRRRSARDRRSVRLELTAAGKALVPQLAERVEANNQRFLAGISQEEQALLKSLLVRILNNTATPTAEGREPTPLDQPKA